jgi:predicted nucleotidyltransferase
MVLDWIRAPFTHREIVSRGQPQAAAPAAIPVDGPACEENIRRARKTARDLGTMAEWPGSSPFPFPPKRVYRGADVPMRLIRRYARAIADEFKPDRIILFGSYAYGTPHEDSDVDLLVVMPARNQHDQAVRIQYRLTAPFPLDLIVRTPQQMSWRLKEGESFTTEIVSKGKVLYESDDQGAGSQRGCFSIAG